MSPFDTDDPFTTQLFDLGLEGAVLVHPSHIISAAETLGIDHDIGHGLTTSETGEEVLQFPAERGRHWSGVSGTGLVLLVFFLFFAILGFGSRARDGLVHQIEFDDVGRRCDGVGFEKKCFGTFRVRTIRFGEDDDCSEGKGLLVMLLGSRWTATIGDSTYLDSS